MTSAERERIAEEILCSFFNEVKQEEYSAIYFCKKYLANCLTGNKEADKIIARGMLNCYNEGFMMGLSTGPVL